jgi:organic radical activating enzyme
VDYPIIEIFHSIQGEGYWTGKSAFFIRLAGCDVGCLWCDTKESWSKTNGVSTSLVTLKDYAIQFDPALIIITGGEPLTHNLDPLTRELCFKPLALETSGTQPYSGNFHWVTLSPKPHRSPLPEIYSKASELKIVVNAESDLFFAEQEAAKMPGQQHLYLQPQWANKSSFDLVIDYVKRNPKWRLSLQTHKFLGVK